MNPVRIRLEDLSRKTVPIGREGENNYTIVIIDCTSVFAQHPNAVVTMRVKPPKGFIYPVTVVRDGNCVIWTVQDIDLASKGDGQFQLTFKEGNIICKTAIGRTLILKSLKTEGPAPDPIQDWLDEAEEVLEELEDAEVNQPIIGEDGYWYTWNQEAGEYQKTDTKAQGEDGQPGAPGQDGTDATPDLITVPYEDLTFPVTAGTQCYHDGKLYEAKQDIASSEAWTAAHWQETTVEAQITDVKNALSLKPDTKDSTKTGIDLDVTDENGNVIVRMKDGDIQTKNFDSASASKVRNSIKTGVDLDVSDDDGNVLLRLKNGHIQTKKFTSEKIEDRTTYVTVKSSGGDFTNLRGAIDYIHEQGDADPVEHPYVILIYPGTYDVLSDYTDDEIRTADVADYHNGFFGPYISDGMSLVGVGDRETIILTASLDPEEYNSTIRHNISTLNTQGNCRLENLTIIAEDIRYCVHDDFSYSGKQYDRIVRNCKFVGINLAHNPSCTWGGGMDEKGENALFENCDFGTDYGCHFNGQESTKIVFRNCCGRKLRLAERNVSVNHYVIIEDSNFEFISLMRPTNVNTQHIKVITSGCENAYVSCYEDDIILTGAISKCPLTSLDVGTMVKRKITSGNGYESTSDPVLADGVVIANDDYFTYVQRMGYINTRILGISSFSLGDYITIDANNKLTTGGTSVNAVGVIAFISQDSDTVDQGIGFVKLLIGGME